LRLNCVRIREYMPTLMVSKVMPKANNSPATIRSRLPVWLAVGAVLANAAATEAVELVVMGARVGAATSTGAATA